MGRTYWLCLCVSKFSLRRMCNHLHYHSMLHLSQINTELVALIYKHFLNRFFKTANNLTQNEQRTQSVRRKKALKYIKSFITSLIIREIQIENSMRYHFLPIRIKKFKSFVMYFVYRAIKNKFPNMVAENVKCYSLCGGKVALSNEITHAFILGTAAIPTCGN